MTMHDHGPSCSQLSTASARESAAIAAHAALWCSGVLLVAVTMVSCPRGASLAFSWCTSKLRPMMSSIGSSRCTPVCCCTASTNLSLPSGSSSSRTTTQDALQTRGLRLSDAFVGLGLRLLCTTPLLRGSTRGVAKCRKGSSSPLCSISLRLALENDTLPSAIRGSKQHALAAEASVHAARGRASGVSHLTVGIARCAADRANTMHLFTS
eukprot:4654-Heterococcus_DN1.PRE.2